MRWFILDRVCGGEDMMFGMGKRGGGEIDYIFDNVDIVRANDVLNGYKI